MKYILAFIMATAIASPALAANVVVSIKPLHSLVSMVMEGSGDTPRLLVDGAQSLHSFSLKPSQISSIQKADMVFYISGNFEPFLDKALDSSPSSVKRIAMAKQPSITLLPVRLNNGFEAHQHDEDEHEAHGEQEEHEYSTDLHIWSSPENAKAMLRIIAQNLITINPAQAALFSTNKDKAIASLDALDAQLKQKMRQLQNRPFVSFHDATQYFEKAYGLTSVGTLTLHPERGTSAKHISEIKAKIAAQKAVCVFHEPQFDAKISNQLLAGTTIKSSSIDPEAALIQPSSELYAQMMGAIAKSFEDCLR